MKVSIGIIVLCVMSITTSGCSAFNSKDFKTLLINTIKSTCSIAVTAGINKVVESTQNKTSENAMSIAKSICEIGTDALSGAGAFGSAPNSTKTADIIYKNIDLTVKRS